MGLKQIGHRVIEYDILDTDFDYIDLFDEDDNGNNGGEYLDPAADEAGFDNNAAYYLDQCTAHDGGIDMVALLAHAYGNEDYYQQLSTIFTKIDANKQIISIAYVVDC